MPKTEVDLLKTFLAKNWSGAPDNKAGRYIGKFFDALLTGNKITAKVNGNHGVYTVSIEVVDKMVSSVCSCYIGKGGYCHHCTALAHTFLNNPSFFKKVETKTRETINNLADLEAYLKGITLDDLIKELRTQGITQKALCESIGMSSRHLSAVKSSELRNCYFHELGATKLACLWVLEHLTNE